MPDILLPNYEPSLFFCIDIFEQAGISLLARIRPVYGQERLLDFMVLAQGIPETQRILRVPGPEQPAVKSIPALLDLPVLQGASRASYKDIDGR
jgi:hypothetical protein